AQRTVRPSGVVLLPPPFDNHFCFPKVIEYFSIQQIVSELTVETLVVAVLPRTSRLNVERLYAKLRQPVLDLFRHELRPIVRTDVFRNSFFNEQLGEYPLYVARRKLSRHW